MNIIEQFLNEGTFPHTKEQSMDHIPYYDHWIVKRLGGEVSLQYLQWIEKYNKKGMKTTDKNNFISYNHRGQKKRTDALVDEFFSPLEATKRWNDLTNKGRDFKKLPDGVFPIALERNGDLVCLDIHYKSNGSIWMWHHVVDKEKLSPLAKDFDELIKKLKRNPNQ